MRNAECGMRNCLENQTNTTKILTKKTKIWFLFVFSLLNWFDLT